MPDGQTALLVVTVLVALGFDFTNGFHDTANAVATSVSTRAMGPRVAVASSAVLNLVGALVAVLLLNRLLNASVSNTIGGLVKPRGGISLGMIIAALVGAIIWNLVTWRAGLPSSSSHALIGGLLGMALVAYGPEAVVWAKVVPTVIFLVVSPLVGLALAYLGTIALLHALRRAHPTVANRRLRIAQIFSGSLVSFSHGANDGQKTMGVITLALVATHHLDAGTKFPSPPVWVVLAAASAIGLGTYAGGWRIIRTLGSRIIRLEPVDGFAAQTASALVIQGGTALGLPLSTTHVVSGAVMGAGATRRLGAVRWGVARSILVAWVLTIPATAIVAGGCALVVRAL